MNVKRHCDLCEHQVLNLKEGTICGLTNKKPNFNTTCLKINFNKNKIGVISKVQRYKII